VAQEDDDVPDAAEGFSALVQDAACAESVVVLKVRVPGTTSFVIVGAVRGDSPAAGLISADARREIWGARLPPGAARQKAREEALAGARIVAIGAREVFIDQRGDTRVVRAESARVVVTDGPRGIPSNASGFTSITNEQRASLEARGREIASAIAAEAIESRRADVGKILERALQRIDRRRDAIKGDLDKIAQADRIASQAQWLIAEASKAPRGATKLVVTDWSTGEAVPIEVRLDPSKSAKDQVTAMFKRAKRLRLGARIAEERLAQAEAQREAVARARAAALQASTLVDLEEVLRQAKRGAPRDVTGVEAGPSLAGASKSSAQKQKRTRTAYRTFVARSGRKVLVGKGAADNDELTLHVARPRDLWLHAKDRTGAHVIVTLDKGETCPSADLVDAAHLAAHFSDAREEKVVDVQYTDRRYIRKPKGSAPGFVVVDREKVLVLRVQPELLRGLLEREEI
jgi:predicted ribosome quality control (RQC) complex YloA/Tae2 family protein